jgi:hypothetical protein
MVVWNSERYIQFIETAGANVVIFLPKKWQKILAAWSSGHRFRLTSRRSGFVSHQGMKEVGKS